MAEVGAAAGGEEVEEEVLGTGGVVEYGEDSGEGATEVGGVQCHGDVDGRLGFAFGRCAGAVYAVHEVRGFT